MRDHLVPSCCSVTKLYLTLCNPMDCSTLGSPVLHHLPGFAQIHVHWIGDAIQTSHPLSSPSPPALNLSQHQGLFQWVGSSPQMPKYWSFSISTASKYSGLISFRIDWFDLLADASWACQKVVTTEAKSCGPAIIWLRYWTWCLSQDSFSGAKRVQSSVRMNSKQSHGSLSDVPNYPSNCLCGRL